MDFVPASDEEDIPFPVPVAAPKCDPLKDPYSFEALIAAAPRRDPVHAVKPPYKQTTIARSPSGARSTCQEVESISEFTKEQPATHQTTVPPSSIAEFSTAPPARKQLICKSSLTSLGPTPDERYNMTLDEFQPPPFPVIDTSDASDYDGGPKTKGELPKLDKKTRKPAKGNGSRSKAPHKSKCTDQAEAEIVDTVTMGVEVEFLCESKPPHKRKTPVEVAHNEPPKKKARKSFMKKLPGRDLALPSLTDSTIPAPRVRLNDAPPSFLDAPNSHLKRNTAESSEDTVQSPNKSKRAKKVLASCEDGSIPEAGSTIELKVTESGKKKGKLEKMPVVDLEDDTAGADASLVVPDEGLYKLRPVIELTKRRSKKNVVQSDEEVDLAGDAFGESEDELLIQSTNTSGKAKAIYRNPASKNDKRGKRKASKAKPKSRETLAAQAPGPGLLAEAPKQLGTSIDGTQDVDATSLVPHDFVLAKSNPLPPLHDTNKPSNKSPSASPPAVAAEPPKPKPKRPSMEHTIPKRRDSMTSLLQRTGLHAPLSSSRLTVPATSRIAPLHLNRKTPPLPPPPIPKPKKKVESEEETDEEEYVGLSEKQIAKRKDEKRKRAWYSP